MALPYTLGPKTYTLITVTDTHAHLDWLEADELQNALEQSRGFRAILNIGTNPVRNRKALEFAEQYPNIWASVGLHPLDVNLLSPEIEADLEGLAQHPRVRAIGETGLDFYWHPQTRLAQYKALEFQHGLALRRNLPLIFHIRSAKGSDQAELETADWLLQNRPPKFVLHAFGGHSRLLEVGLELGGYFSFAGPLTYKKNETLRNAAKEIPLDKLLVETDTPFLPPEPFRGKRNHPALTRYTLAKLAEVRSLEIGELEAITDQTAQTCFDFRP